MMKNSKDLLGSVVKTAQMGKTGLECVLQAPLRPSLRENLEQQAAVYEQIAQEALSLAAGRNWQVEQLGPVARTCSRMVSRARMGGGNSDSKAAAMVMQGSTRGLIKGLQNLHQFPYQDTAREHPGPAAAGFGKRISGADAGLSVRVRLLPDLQGRTDWSMSRTSG